MGFIKAAKTRVRAIAGVIIRDAMAPLLGEIHQQLQDLKHQIGEIHQQLQDLKHQSANLKRQYPDRQTLADGEILVRTGTFNLIVPGWDLSLAPNILMDGSWEPWLTQMLADYCKPGMVALDVGANLGWFSALLASRGAHVHAFEPNPRLQVILRKNIFLNAGLRTPECSVNGCVLGARCSSVSMHFPHWLVGGAGLHDFDQVPFLDSLQQEPVEVEMTTIDAFMANKGLREAHILKIDVEGHEEQVVQGGLGIIRSSPHLLMAIEYTRGRYSDAFPQLLFEVFDRVLLLPEGIAISLSDLVAYEAGERWAERFYLDLACFKG